MIKWYNMLAGEGTGLLRLHSTYRHDLKIYSSDEGRVQVQLYTISSEDERMALRYFKDILEASLLFLVCTKICDRRSSLIEYY